MLEVRSLPLEGLLELVPTRFADERGFFSETYNAQVWRESGLVFDFVQENHSLSRSPGVLRGLHYQLPPAAQTKVVRVTRGRIFDVAVDIRRGSPTFGKWVGIQLSAEQWNQLLVPVGFAHGFVTLEPGTEVQYKVTHCYSPADERVIRFDDPAIGIDWPVDSVEVTLSAKDRSAPLLADAELFS
ncbi:dTDP-4-dehydrorhamnose 3,5-epimerase [Sphingomonas ginkgonis]|uniref:dTDP-4-dehydrorhamnose 3,5-epimerase n=1 Tax=Sphingomonas ginkgonis TaxID=2315330 RepID=A0A429VA00_9SPHN|nr:dTDP-4-dehydrorhamnose 3,5-epimerase [Sphingomonas ginkgonis]RST30809.1 dTDP-4-dehydrorhamnose 3,5-epimerase [Sphingomonas ginkgonis]